MRKVVLVSREGQFSLTEDQEGGRFLEVLSGGFAMYEVEIKLEPDEIAAYLETGERFLIELAGKVRMNSGDLRGRLRVK